MVFRQVLGLFVFNLIFISSIKWSLSTLSPVELLSGFLARYKGMQKLDVVNRKMRINPFTETADNRFEFGIHDLH